MKCPRSISTAVLTAALMLAGPSIASAQQDTKPMHMHKTEMDHSRPDKEVAAEFKTEAQQLSEKAASHRKLAKLYRTRTAPKGGANYTNVAKHCDQLADSYEEAAKRAEAVASELAK